MLHMRKRLASLEDELLITEDQGGALKMLDFLQGSICCCLLLGNLSVLKDQLLLQSLDRCVRVVLIDLEPFALILDRFQHFLERFDFLFPFKYLESKILSHRLLMLKTVGQLLNLLLSFGLDIWGSKVCSRDMYALRCGGCRRRWYSGRVGGTPSVMRRRRCIIIIITFILCIRFTVVCLLMFRNNFLKLDFCFTRLLQAIVLNEIWKSNTFVRFRLFILFREFFRFGQAT
ncbi:hypothetical protein PV05_10402 [Exophiala xenobiotica]|uniref:Uncharacterized protein n=1 Tax=Exophiala xenobiotica TaxID=348802 RepID=A0A0D2CP43_9EURO|nr:uncharacterized protein PV05_10402 [Exophiala xenobiotica]KIW51707.1 hypothetical protein PV05_10402 [Exophiala xenobiotica]